MKINKNETNFMPLAEAAKLTGYTPEYLNSLARKGKLQAKKIGRNWYTQKEWIDNFLSAASGVSPEPRLIIQSIQQDKYEESKKSPEALETPTLEVPLEKRERISFIGEVKKEKAPVTYEPFNWLRIFAALSSVVIIVPLLFAGSFVIRKFVQDYQVGNELEKIYSESVAHSNEIINESDKFGAVAGEEDNFSGGVVLASENFKVSSLTIGGDIMVLENGENLPLEIYDIKSESFLTGKGNEVKLVISWKTNKLAISEIDYSKNNGQNPKTIKENSYGFNHSAVITELEPRTSYVYQIKCKDRWANGNDSSFFGVYTSSKPVSVFDLISEAASEVFGWAISE